MHSQRACVVLALGLLAWSAPAPAADGSYRPLKEIAVGGDGGWDYVSVDSAGRRLYVSHATKVVVIDIDKNAVVGEIAPTPGVHGIAIAPELGRVFVSNGRENDRQHRRPEDAADHRDREDRREPGRHPVRARAQGGLHLQRPQQVRDGLRRETGEVRATIPLPGKPEFAVVDVKAGRIYNNIEDTSELVAIDTATHAVVATWPIAPGEEASGLAIDLAHHRLFIGCRNNLMVMMDSTTRQGPGERPDRPRRRRERVRPGHRPTRSRRAATAR